MAETDISQKFIKSQKEEYGRVLHIEKVFNSLRKGEPDIFAIYKGMPLYAEVKLVNSIPLTNLYPFKKLQLEILAIKARAGAICIGILGNGKEYRYIMYDKLTEHITKEEYLNAEIFEWEKLRSLWMKSILTSF